MKLHLGVVDVPYSGRAAEPPKKVSKAKKGKAAKPRKVENGTQTTGDVAEWLEKKYNIMGAFAAIRETEIADAFANSIAGALEGLMMGAPAGGNPFGQAESDIEQMFRTFLDLNVMANTGTPGVPTHAALMGVNHRFKAKRGSPRPSFIDTGLYQSSFKAWIA